MKVTVYTYVRNLGDGSNSVKFFNSAEDAEKFAKKDEQEYADRYCDDISYYTLEFDENGILLNPAVYDN